MLPIGIISGLFGIVAAVLAIHVSDVWLIAMIGSFALASGCAVGIWADLDGPRWSVRKSWKVGVGIFSGLALAPAILIGALLFTFTLMPALVLILPLIAVWEFTAVRPSKAALPVLPDLTPRHA